MLIASEPHESVWTCCRVPSRLMTVTLLSSRSHFLRLSWRGARTIKKWISLLFFVSISTKNIMEFRQLKLYIKIYHLFEFDQSFNIHRNRMLLLSTTYVSDRNPLCNLTRGSSQHFDWVWYTSLLITWYVWKSAHPSWHFYTSQTKSHLSLSTAVLALSCWPTFSICYFWRQVAFFATSIPILQNPQVER